MAIDFQQIPSPCFVLDEAALLKNLNTIKKVADEAEVKIILALKGFAMYHVFDTIKQYLPGTTASSIHETRLAKEEFGGEIHGYAPVFLDDEFGDWMNYCQHITFNSLNQFEKYKKQINEHQNSISSGLRINTEYSEVTTDMYNPCIAGSRLGIRAKDLGDKLPEGVEGLHFHSLCENNSYTLEKTLATVEAKFGHFLEDIKWINFGGGHLMTHKDYNVEHLITVLKSFKTRHPNLVIIMEPGSAIAWETGCLVSKVQDLFDSEGIQSAILDISVAAHMPDCLEMPYTPSVIGAEILPLASDQKRTRLGGTSCLAGDYVGDYHFPKALKIGDRVVFEDMMHYTMVKTNFFNGVNHPSIGVWRAKGEFELLKTFSYQQFKDKL